MNEMLVEGPFFEDLEVGQVFDTAPSVTLTDGLAASHQAIVGERLRAVLDRRLGSRLGGGGAPLAPPSLVWDVSIGQSTPVTHFVRANLFYRGLAFHRFAAIGDTLTTRTEVAGLRENSRKPDRVPTGLAALRISTRDQEGRVVLDFLRCAMLPLRPDASPTGRFDDLDALGVEDSGAGWAAVAAQLARDEFVSALPGGVPPLVRVGDSWRIAAGDVVSSAPELARLTTNVARVHHDDFGGERLVYGGHAIGLVLTQCVRALPDVATVLAWHSCDHLGPVREGDTLTTAFAVEQVDGTPTGWRLVHLHAKSAARSSPGEDARPVLDWRFVALLP